MKTLKTNDSSFERDRHGPYLCELDSSGKGYSYEFRKDDKILWSAIEDRLVQANVLAPDNELTSYKELSPWERRGAETYGCVIEIGFREKGQFEQETKRVIIVKAIVSPVTDIQKRANEWARRARHLEKSGVKTCTFGVAKGCIYQEFLPCSAEDYLVLQIQKSDAESLAYFLDSLRTLAEKVGKAGFNPVSLLSDLRMLDKELVIVDLGEDLGQEKKENLELQITTLLKYEVLRLTHSYLVSGKMLSLIQEFVGKAQFNQEGVNDRFVLS